MNWFQVLYFDCGNTTFIFIGFCALQSALQKEYNDFPCKIKNKVWKNYIDKNQLSSDLVRAFLTQIFFAVPSSVNMQSGFSSSSPKYYTCTKSAQLHQELECMHLQTTQCLCKTKSIRLTHAT